MSRGYEVRVELKFDFAVYGLVSRTRYFLSSISGETEKAEKCQIAVILSDEKEEVKNASSPISKMAS